MTHLLRRTPWSPERAARLGFLVGAGWDARRVAGDPRIAASVGNVHRMAHRFGLAFGDAETLRLPPDALAGFDAAATRRRLSREGVIRTVLVATGTVPSLLDRILDRHLPPEAHLP